MKTENQDVKVALADNAIDKSMKRLTDNIRKAQYKLDDAIGAYNRVKANMQKDGLWQEYCDRVGAVTSHSGEDFR